MIKQIIVEKYGCDLTKYIVFQLHGGCNDRLDKDGKWINDYGHSTTKFNSRREAIQILRAAHKVIGGGVDQPDRHMNSTMFRVKFDV